VNKVNKVIYTNVPQDVGNFLISSETTSFSRMTQPHGMSYLIYCHTVFLEQLTVCGVQSS
jgi:hypothetical protein